MAMAVRELILLLLLSQTLSQTVPAVPITFNESDLNFINGVQNVFCANKTVCNITRTPATSEIREKAAVSNNDFTDIPVQVPEYTDGSCCEFCSCDLDVCHLSGTCCPDILDHVPSIKESLSEVKVSCEYSHLRIDSELPQGEYPLWMRTKCSNDFRIDGDVNNAVIQHKCENSDGYSNLDVKIPVTDSITLEIYKNRYCAQCNNVSSEAIVFWNPYIDCVDEKEGAFLSNVFGNDIVFQISKTKTCNIIYHWPEFLNPRQSGCLPALIKECNVTGLWQKYDPLIEAACYAYASIYNFKYNNVFCYMCNELTTLNKCETTAGRAIVSFSVLLNFNPVTDTHSAETDDKTCAQSQVYDPLKNMCRDLSCRFPKRLELGECVNFVDSLTEVAYRLYLKFTPTEQLARNDLQESAYALRFDVLDLFDTWGVLHAVYTFDLFCKLPTTSSTLTPLSTTLPSRTANLTGFIKTTATSKQVNNVEGLATITEFTTLYREVLLDTTPFQGRKDKVLATTSPLVGSFIIDYFIIKIDMYFGSKTGTTHNISSIDKILDDDGKTRTISSEFTNYSLDFKVEIEDLTSGDAYPNGAITDMTDNVSLTVVQGPNLLPPFPDVQEIPLITITKTFNCPLVTLNTSDFQIDAIPNGIYIPELNSTIRKKYYYEIVTDGQVNYLVCADVYLAIADRLVGQKQTPSTDEGPFKPQEILSVVCTCLSLLCSVLTLLTYILFKELRTQPGVNNMGLIISLIFAQALLQFGSGRVDTVPKWGCPVIGVFVHFTWLMVLFWMNVCSFHMFRVFNGFGKLRQHSNLRRTTIFYSVYSLCASLLFVVINIIVVTVDTNQSEIGYGGRVCYISRPEMVGYLFAVPVGIIIVTNLVLFLVVIIRVSRLPTVETNVKNSRNYFKIYAKLSTLTGITWIFGFLFFFIGEPFLEYVFIILNAGQGVFVFVSYVCNKRVFTLYRERFIGKGKPSSGTPEKIQKTKETSLTERNNGPVTA